MTDFYDAEDLRQFRARRHKQKEYSRANRAKCKRENIPTADDVKAAISRVILGHLGRDHRANENLVRGIVRSLASKGFDDDRAADKLRDMILKARAKVST